MRSLYLHRAIASGGPVAAFSLRLRHDVEQQAREQPSAASWLLKRVRREVHAILKRDVPVWFVIEQDYGRARGMHLHGELAVTQEELPAARKALRLAAGQWLFARQHQAHTRLSPDEGWIAYVLKDAVQTRKP